MKLSTAEPGAEGAIVSTAAEMRAELIEAQTDRAALAEILAFVPGRTHNVAVNRWCDEQAGDFRRYLDAMRRVPTARREA